MNATAELPSPPVPVVIAANGTATLTAHCSIPEVDAEGYADLIWSVTGGATGTNLGGAYAEKTTVN